MTAPAIERIAYTRQEAAALVSLSVDVIDNAREAGELVSHFHNRTVRIGREDLIRWFESLPTEKRDP